ncbi:HAD-IIA family hydrolase [Radiobacillus sp. PE A8.2]|uniref:HAD-IIA family hydrolase n=1 Tax=Radiobacillus sp. PE A8.2 TaxID=3380349 RepID=UPI00388F5CD7
MKGFIFDLDGTLYRGNKVIEGAPETLSLIRNRGDRVVFLTNKPIVSREQYVEKLKKMGIMANLNEIINSNLITVKYLKKHMTIKDKVLVISEQPLLDELKENYIAITDNPAEATYVILSWDREFTYKKLDNAFQAWRNGARVLATNPDRTCPVEHGFVPDCGAIIGALEGATGEAVELIMGKPSHLMAEEAKSVLNLDYSDCFMVGDRLETDIKMANDIGFHSILVLTGSTSLADVELSTNKPSYTLNSVKEIVSIK